MQSQYSSSLSPTPSSMMVHSFDILSSTSKTEQIMARYRPIAPKPQLNQTPNGDPTIAEQNLLPCIMGIPSASSQSVFITKPVRGRKRRTTLPTSPRTKKVKNQEASPLVTPLDLDLGFHHNFVGFPPFRDAGFVGKLKKPTSCGHHFFNLSLLPCSSSPLPMHKSLQTGVPDMGSTNQSLTREHVITEEKDLLLKLHAPQTPASPGQVIAPQPVRPVGSSISVKSICECDDGASSVPVFKRPEEVEEEVESEALPAVVSDSNNRVRLVNSAYKELVGQPECSWLESLVAAVGKRQQPAKRINGEVLLLFADFPVPNSSNAFSCRVEIEWTSNGHKCHTTAACDVARLSCESKAYHFSWRFRVCNESCESSF